MSTQKIYVGNIKNQLPLLRAKSRNPEAVPVHFENDDSALLDINNSRSAIWVEMINLLQRDNKPVYIAIDAETGVITRIGIPFVTSVLDILTEGEDTRVSFTGSDAWHHIDWGQPGYDGILGALHQAKDTGSAIMVTATLHRYQIVDVRPFPALGISNDIPEAPSAGLPFTPVSPERAVEIFNKMSALTCTPNFISAPCIPFKYPSTACWVRAHRMCQMMVDEGLTPAKAWIIGRNLKAYTTDDPNCIVTWPWHVAPTLMVTQKDGQAIKMVFDPALCTEPVTSDEWQAKMNDPEARIEHMSWKGYKFLATGRATLEETEKDLEHYRVLLKDMWEEDGLPPYECSPAEDV